jgi:uncharacterized RDD family membrane protein YckC
MHFSGTSRQESGKLTETKTDFRVLAIRTPEGVRFQLPLAGPTSRFLAWLLDAVVINGAFALVVRFVSLGRALDADLTGAILILCYFLLTVGYPIALEWMWRGQTVGKRIFGLRVIDAGGKRLEFTQILLRNLLRLVDALPFLYLVGGASLVLTRRCQRLGDLAASTVVIRQRKLALPNIPVSQDAERFNSLLDHPHLAARLRQSTPVPLAQIAMEALLRRAELTPDARIEVFRALAARFKLIVAFPEETLAGMADERYVRNCLEVVLNTGNLRRHVHHQHTQSNPT